MSQNKILIINGPNLELLGTREPDIYGINTLKNINDNLKQKAKDKDIECSFFQSNIEGEIVNKINSSKSFDAIIINPAEYTHTSIAIMDSLKAYSGYKVEVHLTNIYSREEFRHNSFASKAVDLVISGAGSYSYELALLSICDKLKI